MATDSEPDLPALRPPSPERRDAVVQALSDHFAAGRIELEDLERRLDRAVRAQTLEELDALLADLQAPPPPAPDPVAVEPARAPTARSERWTVAVLTGRSRRGRFRLAPVHRVLAVMGGGKLDLREAELTAPVTELRIRAVMGGVVVVVPAEVDVEVRGVGLMGRVQDRTTRRETPPPAGAPRLVIRAFALMGGIEVKLQARPGPLDADPRRRSLLP